MEKEFITTEELTETVNVTDGKVDSFRENNETRRTARVYEGGKIGVAGALGKGDEKAKAELFIKAEKSLERGVPYVCKLSKNVKAVNRPMAIKDEVFLGSAKRLAKKAAAACPNFLVGGKICRAERKVNYENSAGADLCYSGSVFECSFLLKDRKSSNIMDAGYGASTDRYGLTFENGVVEDMRSLHDAYFTKPVKLKDGVYPMIFGVYDLFGLIIKDFIAEYYVSGGSLFSGKLGQKVFNENLSVYTDSNPKTAYLCEFFDAEGEIAPESRGALIDGGVIKNVLASKNGAAEFGLPLIKSAGASYDGVPAAGLKGLYVKPNFATVAELCEKLKIKKAVYIDTTSGGDITPDGVFGLPVQLAFLVENGKITRKIKDFQVSASAFDIFGKDLLGTTERGVFKACRDGKLVVKAKLINQSEE